MGCLSLMTSRVPNPSRNAPLLHLRQSANCEVLHRRDDIMFNARNDIVHLLLLMKVGDLGWEKESTAR